MNCILYFIIKIVTWELLDSKEEKKKRVIDGDQI